jgi:hypothetical protein
VVWTNISEEFAPFVFEADHENGGRTFLRNLGKYLPDYSITFQ